MSNYKNIFQYIYFNAFTEIYCSTEKRGFDLKSNFHIVFKKYKEKEQLQSSLGKDPENYENIRKKTNIYEKNPLIIDDFNEVQKKRLRNVLKNEGKKCES